MKKNQKKMMMMMMMTRNKKLKKKFAAFVCLFFVLTIGVNFSCCKTTDKDSVKVEKSKNAGSDKQKKSNSSFKFSDSVGHVDVGGKKESVKPVEKSDNTSDSRLAMVKDSETDSSVKNYYDSLLEKKRQKLSGFGLDTKQMPEWINSFSNDKYFYVVGVSSMVTSKSTSLTRAEEDAMNELYAAAKSFQGADSKPKITGWESVEYHTQTFTHEKSGKTVYVAAVLVKIPRKKILGE